MGLPVSTTIPCGLLGAVVVVFAGFFGFVVVLLSELFFVVSLLEMKFNEFKTEWKLLVKKANNWLQQQVEINEEMKEKIGLYR